MYPSVLAAIYKPFGEGVTTVRLVQAVFGAGSCVMLAAAGMRLFGERGAVAGLLPAEAIRFFERALALSPGDETIRKNLERARQLK